MKNVTIISHPLISHKVALMRDINTNTKQFRELVEEVTTLLTYEAFKDLPTVPVTVTTPLETTEQQMIAENTIAIVPILRAGLGMVNGVHTLFPTAKVGHIGMYRDEETCIPQEYYCKLPKEAPESQVIVVDPALATGGSAAAAIDFIKQRGCKQIKLLSLIAAPEGIKRVAERHPDVKIYVAHYADAPLNEKGYIVTAFGDAGDRIFGTK